MCLSFSVLLKGANFAEDPSSDDPSVVFSSAPRRITHLMLQNEIPLSTTRAFLSYGGSHGVLSAWNPSPMPSTSELREMDWPALGVLIVNEGEGFDLLAALAPELAGDAQEKSEEELQARAGELLDKLEMLKELKEMKWIVVTRGAKGVLARVRTDDGGERQTFDMPAAKPKQVKDTVSSPSPSLPPTPNLPADTSLSPFPLPQTDRRRRHLRRQPPRRPHAHPPRSVDPPLARTSRGNSEMGRSGGRDGRRDRGRDGVYPCRRGCAEEVGWEVRASERVRVRGLYATNNEMHRCIDGQIGFRTELAFHSPQSDIRQNSGRTNVKLGKRVSTFHSHFICTLNIKITLHIHFSTAMVKAMVAFAFLLLGKLNWQDQTRKRGTGRDETQRDERNATTSKDRQSNNLQHCRLAKERTRERRLGERSGGTKREREQKESTDRRLRPLPLPSLANGRKAKGQKKGKRGKRERGKGGRGEKRTWSEVAHPTRIFYLPALPAFVYCTFFTLTKIPSRLPVSHWPILPSRCCSPSLCLLPFLSLPFPIPYIHPTSISISPSIKVHPSPTSHSPSLFAPHSPRVPSHLQD